MSQHIRNSPYRRVSEQNIPQREKHRKVEDRRESAVNSIIAPDSPCEERGHTRIRVKHFSDRGQIRINPPKPGMPLCPELPSNVRKRIHTIAIQSGNLRPPQAILQKVFLDDWVLRVHIRQTPEKPAFRQVLLHPLRRVRIDQRLERLIRPFLLTRLSVKRFLQW